MHLRKNIHASTAKPASVSSTIMPTRYVAGVSKIGGMSSGTAIPLPRRARRREPQRPRRAEGKRRGLAAAMRAATTRPADTPADPETRALRLVLVPDH